MTTKEFESIQVLISKYNNLFIECDLLRYENVSFQKELLDCYRQLAEFKERYEGTDATESLISELVPLPIAMPVVTADPISIPISVIPPEIKIEPENTPNEGKQEVTFLTPEQFRAILAEAMKLEEEESKRLSRPQVIQEPTKVVKKRVKKVYNFPAQPEEKKERKSK